MFAFTHKPVNSVKLSEKYQIQATKEPGLLCVQAIFIGFFHAKQKELFLMLLPTD